MIMGDIPILLYFFPILKIPERHPDFILILVGFDHVVAIGDHGIENTFNRRRIFDEAVQSDNIVTKEGDVGIGGEIV